MADDSSDTLHVYPLVVLLQAQLDPHTIFIAVYRYMYSLSYLNSRLVPTCRAGHRAGIATSMCRYVSVSI